MRYTANSEQTSVAADIGVRTQAQAERSLLALDAAIANILQARSSVSANIHRLESAANLALLQAENLETARENIVGVDLAEETAKLVSAQILQQAQVAIAAQANLNLAVVLELFRNL